MGTKPYYKVFLFVTLLFIITPLTVPLLHAQTYYADLSITVDPSGFITIEGPTNYPNLTIINTQNYTSKQHSLWLLNITKPEIFSQLIYTVTLPRGSTINYIKASGFTGIKEDQGRLIVRGFGENESLSILIQYQTEKIEDVFFQETIVYSVLFSLILLVCILLVYFYRKEKKTKPSEIKIEPPGDWKGLNHRQKQIMQLLTERNIPLTQTDLQKELLIPKASISRNIRGLEKRGLIEKESIGMSNLIRLKKP
ncbi:MAG: MarR family transcriptional regulator [Euryarchaeota archaeon]|nr:MarR family transcriptional regulator [Euryarchaeota archaeon]